MHSLLQERACVKIAIAIKLTFWKIEGKLSGDLLRFSSQVAQLFLNFTDSLWTTLFFMLLTLKPQSCFFLSNQNVNPKRTTGCSTHRICCWRHLYYICRMWERIKFLCPASLYYNSSYATSQFFVQALGQSLGTELFPSHLPFSSPSEKAR